MLFLADSYFPRPDVSFGRESKVDKTVIRLTSAQKWPDKVVYDTRLPTIVPSSSINASISISKIEETPAPPASASVHQAFAKMATIAPASERALVHAKRKVKRKSAEARLLAYREPTYSWPAGW